jgi:hypothetical protein
MVSLNSECNSGSCHTMYVYTLVKPYQARYLVMRVILGLHLQPAVHPLLTSVESQSSFTFRTFVTYCPARCLPSVRQDCILLRQDCILFFCCFRQSLQPTHRNDEYKHGIEQSITESLQCSLSDTLDLCCSWYHFYGLSCSRLFFTKLAQII